MRRVLFAMLAIILSSCAAPIYYQVYSITSETADYSPNGSLIFRTDDGLEFTYNFWGEAGNLRFIIYNSNDYDVIVDMTKSSFIRNNIAEDYFTGKEIENRIATGVYKTSKYGVSTSVDASVGVSSITNFLGRTYDVALALGAEESRNVEVGSAVKKEWQTAIIYKEPETVRIPARSAKAFCSFNINSCLITSPSLRASWSYDPILFDKESSPLIMRNRICVYKEDGAPTFYDMDFYINEIGNVTDLNIIEPTLFYISYSSTLENGKPSVNDELIITNNELKEDSIDNTISDELTEDATTADYVITVSKCDSNGTWYDAVEYCQSLGEGWELPNSEQVMYICDNFDIKFSSCWTNTEVNDKKAKVYNRGYTSTMTMPKSTNDIVIIAVKVVDKEVE